MNTPEDKKARYGHFNQVYFAKRVSYLYREKIFETDEAIDRVFES